MINHGTLPKGIYPQRPSPVGLCKCGHKYTDHKLRCRDDDLMEGNWFQRNVMTIGFMFAGLGIYRRECYECMCPMYEQVKIVDEKTGNEIQNYTGVNY